MLHGLGFQDATANLEMNTLTEFYKLGITNVLKPDLVHISKGVKSERA